MEIAQSLVPSRRIRKKLRAGDFGSPARCLLIILYASYLQPSGVGCLPGGQDGGLDGGGAGFVTAGVAGCGGGGGGGAGFTAGVGGGACGGGGAGFKAGVGPGG